MIKFTPDEHRHWKAIVTKIVGNEVAQWDPPGPSFTDMAVQAGVNSFAVQRAIAHIATQVEPPQEEEDGPAT
jgi:hypothetical protein